MGQLPVLLRIYRIEARSHHADRKTSSFECASVCRRIDAPRETRNYGNAAFGQLARKLLGDIATVGGPASRPDNCDHRLRKRSYEVTSTVDYDWRIVCFAEQTGIPFVGQY